jgi:hypothetical protein
MSETGREMQETRRGLVTPLERGLLVVIWLAFVAAVAAIALRLLIGCGIGLPSFLQGLAWCEVPPDPVFEQLALAREENALLTNQYDTLRQQLASQPACPPEDCLWATAEGDVDILLLQDLSSSFKEELPIIGQMVREYIAQRESGDLSDSVLLGLASFVDKPVAPYGGADDYVLKLHSPIGSDTGQLLDEVDGLTIGSGGETGEEAQFEAIQRVTEQPRSFGYRPEARRYLVIVTDAPSQHDGTWADAPKANDGIPDDDDLDEDYPSLDQVVESLRRTGITPVFVLTDPGLYPYYQPLIDGVGSGAIITYRRGADGLFDTILGGVQDACIANAR